MVQNGQAGEKLFATPAVVERTCSLEVIQTSLILFGQELYFSDLVLSFVKWRLAYLPT